VTSGENACGLAAYRLLEQLQAQSFASLGQVPPDYSVTGLDKDLANKVHAILDQDSSQSGARDLRETWLAELQKAYETRPTRYEDPRVYLLLTSLQKSLEGAIEEHGASVPQVFIGSLATGRINAITLAVPGTETYVVAFERELFHFALLMSKAVAQAFPMTVGPDDVIGFETNLASIRKNLLAKPEVASRFAEAVLAYAVYGRPALAQPYLLTDRNTLTMSNALRNAMLLFALGHEYGHSLAGHLRTASRRVHPAAEAVAEEVLFRWTQEYEADEIGMRLSIPALRRHAAADHAIAFAGGVLYFAAMEVMARAVTLLRCGDDKQGHSGSHPPPRARRAALGTALEFTIGEDQAAGAVALGDQVGTVVEELWAEAREVIRRARRKGLRPVHLWHSVQ
jgi:hypothetical protein